MPAKPRRQPLGHALVMWAGFQVPVPVPAPAGLEGQPPAELARWLPARGLQLRHGCRHQPHSNPGVTSTGPHHYMLSCPAVNSN